MGNGLGGLTAQTAFIAVADLFYRRANLEHAAASVTGLAQGVLLVALLCIPLLASVLPQVTLWAIHPAALVIPVGYGLGLKLFADIKSEPMWRPVQTEETRPPISDPEQGQLLVSDRSLWTRLGVYAAITAVAGYAIGQASVTLVEKTGLAESAIGTAFASIATSLPELATAITAVRIGAVSLAVGNVIGGNSFEVLFLNASDLVYGSSIYGAMTAENQWTGLAAMLMTGVLLLGMLRRVRVGIGRTGFEGVLVLLIYAGSVALLFF